MAVLSEHHATSDGHLPSPLVLASAIAARTSYSIFWWPRRCCRFYHPVRLAEDMTVLDNLSKGRFTMSSESATAQRNTSTWASTSAGAARSPTRALR